MAKLITILMIGLVMEALGVAFLSRGLHEIGELKRISAGEVARIVGRAAANGAVQLGVLFQAISFGILLCLLAQRDLSLIWPLTSLGFVVTALAARFIRHETITNLRWTGIVLIVIGAAIVAWSEPTKAVHAHDALSAAAVTQKP